MPGSSQTCIDVNKPACAETNATQIFSQIDGNSNILSLNSLINLGCLLPANLAATTPQFLIFNKSLQIDIPYTFAQGSEIIFVRTGLSAPGLIVSALLLVKSTTLHTCGVSWNGISIRQNGNLRIYNSRIKLADYGIHFEDNNSKLLSYNNEFINCHIAGYYGSNKSGLQMLILSDDHTTNMASPVSVLKSAVQFSDCSPVRMSGVTISGFNRANEQPVYVKNTSLTLQGTLSNYGEIAVGAESTVPGKHNLIINGTSINGGSQPNTGVGCIGYNLYCQGSTFNANSSGILYLPNGSTLFKISGNDFVNFRRYGLVINEPTILSGAGSFDYGGQIDDNNFTGNNSFDNAVVVGARQGSQNSIWIAHSNILSGVRSGISVLSCQSVDVHHNTFTGTIGDGRGISVLFGEDYEITENIINARMVDGIRNPLSPKYILGCNQISGFSDFGILCTNSDNAKITKNTLTSNAPMGIESIGINDQHNMSNRWFGNITCRARIPMFNCEVSHGNTEFDPKSTCHPGQYSGTDITFSCGNIVNPPCPDCPTPVPVIITSLMESVINGSYNPGTGYEGLLWDHQFYTYDVLFQNPTLLSGNNAAQTYFNNYSNSSAGALYSFYSDWKDLYDESVYAEMKTNKKEITANENEFGDLFDQILLDWNENDVDNYWSDMEDLEAESNSLNGQFITNYNTLNALVSVKLNDLASDIANFNAANAIESDLKTVLLIFVNKLINGNWGAQELEILESISEKCFYQNGTGTRIARWSFGQEFDDESICQPQPILDTGDNTSETSLLLYPSIADNVIHLEMQGLCEVKIIDVYGNQLYRHDLMNTDNYLVNLSLLPAGAYFVRVKSIANTVKLGKFIKL